MTCLTFGVPIPVWSQAADTGFLDRSVVVEDSVYRYQVYVPRGYDAETPWPIVLSLHGSGPASQGEDGLRHTNWGLASSIRANRDAWQAIVVFPQARRGDTWIGVLGDVAMAALEATETEFRTDASRTYLTGFSLGGNGAWYLAYRYPRRFAALLVVAGYVSELRGLPAVMDAEDPHLAVAGGLAEMPIWIVHGSDDPNVPVTEARRMESALRGVGADVRYTELPRAGHDVWRFAYGDPNVLDWLFAQRRARSSPSRPLPGGSRTRAEPVVQTASPGGRPRVREASAGARAAECSIPWTERRALAGFIEAWSSRHRESGDIPGIALAAVCGDSLLYLGGNGWADPRTGLESSGRTPYRIASVTKVFTAIAVLQLRDLGRLTLSDPVSAHLPDFDIRGRDPARPITVRHLLTHSSGLPTNSILTDFTAMNQPQTEDALQALPRQSLTTPPGETYKYSNLGFGLLGAIVERVSGQPFGEYLDDRVIGALGLTGTVAHPARGDITAVGHGSRLPGAERRRDEFLALNFATPAGGMASTAHDLGAFIVWQLDPESGAGVLSPETVREMQDLQFPVGGRQSGVGFAWAVDRTDGGHEVYHSGELPTQASMVRIDLANGLGTAVLTNAEDGEPAIVAEAVLSLMRLAATAAPSSTPASLGRFAGVFEWRERRLWSIELGGSLRLLDIRSDRPGATAITLERTGEESTFVIRGGWANGEMAHFAMDRESGRPLRLELPSLTFTYVGEAR